MRLIELVISLAPIGVAALLFTLTAQLGYEILVQLARYVGVVLLGARDPPVRRLLAGGAASSAA